MFLRFRIFLLMALALPCFILTSCSDDDGNDDNDAGLYDVVVDFQDADIPADPGYIDNAGAGLDGIFAEGIISFPNYYNTQYGSWSGFAYSQVHDMETNDYKNLGVYVGSDPSTNKFMIIHAADPADYSPKISFSFSQPVTDLSFDIANASYAALSMKNGDDYAKKFTDEDWFKLYIQFYDTNGEAVFIDNDGEPKPAELLLAEGTRILNTWAKMSTTGGVVSKVEFSLESSDTGNLGMNTPAYFCIDNIKARTVK